MRQRRRRQRHIITGIASGAIQALVLALWIVPAQAQSSGELEEVVLQLKWLHQFQFAGYYAAVEQGYYRDAGLEVTIREAEPGHEPMQEVVEGRAHFGVGTTDLLLMRAEGEDVMVLANIFQHSPLALMALKTEEARNIHELAAGRLMIEPHSAELFAYLAVEGLDPDRLDIVDHDFNVENLISGHVDAMSVYGTDEPYLLARQQIPYLLFRPIESGIDFYGDNLFAMQSEIDANPERTRRFVEASLRGWDYAMAHPREIAELIVTRYPTVKTLEHLLFEADAMQPLINANVVKVGYTNPDRWRRIAETYADVGMIERGFDIDGFIYTGESEVDLDLVWQLLAIMGGIAILLAGLALWCGRMNERLRVEVAERKRAQAELESLNGQKALLLSIIGHDLRAPFSVLLNYGDLLVTQGKTMEQARLVSVFHTVREAASAAYALLNNLLEWAALETGSSQVSPETFDTVDLVEHVVELTKPQADAKGINLHRDVPPQLSIHADRRMVETVLRNLIVNAIKYTVPGGEITVAARQEGSEALVQVIDSGVGMAPERVERLFAFENKRPVPGTARETGSGIGLILCRDLVDANKGSLSVESTLGAGTTVSLRLPSAPGGEPNA